MYWQIMVVECSYTVKYASAHALYVLITGTQPQEPLFSHLVQAQGADDSSHGKARGGHCG